MMENKSRNPNDQPPKQETQLTFDQFIAQLPGSKQSAHRWVSWLAIAALVLTIGVFIYAIYTSITWETAGGTNVVLAWIFFFLAGAIAAFLLGLDSMIVGATIPLPFEGSKYDFTTGPKAIKEGRNLLAYGVVVIILGIAGAISVRAGVFGIEDWVKFIVGLFVIVGIGSGVLAALRRIR